jgi:hypothetical protein
MIHTTKVQAAWAWQQAMLRDTRDNGCAFSQTRRAALWLFVIALALAGLVVLHG